MGSRTARLLGGLGHALITVGVLLVLFAAFQLWGTSLAEDQAQDGLEDSFEERRAALQAVVVDPSPTTAPTADPTTTTEPAGDGDDADPTTTDAAGDGDSAPSSTPPPPEPNPAPVEDDVRPVPVVAPELAAELMPDLGETVGRIQIPAIAVDKYVIEGVRRSDLRQAPGHYPDTPLPGQAGNAAIAGHRTTYGAPFGDLDRLVPGDEIVVETLQGTFRYEVMGHPGPGGTTVGHFIVDPYDGVVVLEDAGDNRLTLTACHPRYSARQRIVVTAALTTPPAPAVPPLLAAAPGDATPGPEGDDADGAAAERDEGEVDAAPDDAADGPRDGTADELDGGEEPQDDATVGGGEEPQDDGTADDDETSAIVGDDEMALDGSLGWNTDDLPTVLAWAAITAVLALLVVLAGRAWRRWPAWILGAPLVLTALFVTFGHLDRIMPAL